MGALFDSPEIPTPPPPPPPPAPPIVPTIDDARAKLGNVDTRKGRGATVLTGPKGDLATPKTASKTLLGG